MLKELVCRATFENGVKRRLSERGFARLYVEIMADIYRKSWKILLKSYRNARASGSDVREVFGDKDPESISIGVLVHTFTRMGVNEHECFTLLSSSCSLLPGVHLSCHTHRYENLEHSM